MPKITHTEIVMEITPDPHGSGWSSLSAVTDIHIPYENHYITQRIQSPGLFTNLSKAGETSPYVREVYEDECEILRHMLAALGVEV